MGDHGGQLWVAAQHSLHRLWPGMATGDRSIAAVHHRWRGRVGEQSPHPVQPAVGRVEFADLNVHLDTTMVGTPFTEALMPFDRGLLPRLAALRDRVVLGSDFPNIPYRYAEQLAALERFDLGDDWLQAVCWHNGQRLLG